MDTQSRAARILLAPVVAWIAFFVIGGYFMVSCDPKVMKKPVEPGVWEQIKKRISALQFAYVKKGIDLAGGAYLVLGVELEKAIENRLGIESRTLDTLFKNKGLKVLPVKKEIKNLTIDITFSDEASAKVAHNMIQEAKVQSLRAKVSDTQVTVTLSPELEQSIRVGSIEQAINVLTTRLGGYGVEGIIVQQHGDRQVVIQLPGVEDLEHIKSVITKTAHLEFKMVEKTAGSRQALLDEFDGDLPSDKMIVSGRQDVEDAEESGRWYLVSVFPDLTGDRIVTAKVEHDEYNKPVVHMKFDSIGSREFADLTSNNIKRQLGIIIDNIMISAPVIQTAIAGGSAIISNIPTPKEALDLSIVLKSGSLSAPLKVDQESIIGSSLGQDSISKGISACIVALILLFIFSVFYYRFPGLFAVIALLCNLFLTMLFLSYFKATLTMPGIAGMILTIGMAIDVSILVFERVKEELASGVTLRKAVDTGFSGALSVILDSNITTFLTGIVLYQFGGPAIRGFAVTLMLGIIATLLAGIFFQKSIFSFVFDALEVKELRFK
jgi:preprotein translocase subunit SecD